MILAKEEEEEVLMDLEVDSILAKEDKGVLPVLWADLIPANKEEEELLMDLGVGLISAKEEGKDISSVLKVG